MSGGGNSVSAFSGHSTMQIVRALKYSRNPASHAVQVEVDYLDRLSADLHAVRFGQRVGWTSDMSGVSGSMQQRARQRSLAGAKVAVQINRQARRECA
jgi:hypothetical protein